MTTLSDLKLKSETKRADKLHSLMTMRPVDFFHLHVDKLADRMNGIKLTYRETDGAVVVTHDSFPGQRYCIMPTNQAYLCWRDAE